jgi:hypothetical protein
MSGLIDLRIDVDDTKLRLRLDQLPTKLRQALKAKIRELTTELLHKVEAREPVRTGRLRRLTQSYVDENPAKQFVRGRVRVLRSRDHNAAAAAGALEYGSTGKRYAVRGYTRRGRPVQGYMRRGGIQAQRFLRGPAAAMMPKARAELQAVLTKFAADALK